MYLPLANVIPLALLEDPIIHNMELFSAYFCFSSPFPHSLLCLHRPTTSRPMGFFIIASAVALLASNVIATAVPQPGKWKHSKGQWKTSCY